MASEAWEELCQRTVLGILAKRGWQLAQDEKAFASQVCIEVHLRQLQDAGKERVAMERAAVRHYCISLHAACRETGSRRQRRAFEELWQYLYPIALYKTHGADLAQDLAQQALAKVWKKISQCREPGSFLGWATLVLINEIREYYRGKGRREGIVEDAEQSNPEITASDMNRRDETEGETEFDREISAADKTGLDLAMAEETHRELLAIIKECVRNPQQQRIVVELFFNDKGYKEISEELGITIGNVHVLRHRALGALRKCSAFIRFIEDEFK